MITVNGQHLLDVRDRYGRAHLSCHFESNGTEVLSSPATILSLASARCRAPKTAIAGEVRIELRHALQASDAPRAHFTFFDFGRASENASTTAAEAIGAE